MKTPKAAKPKTFKDIKKPSVQSNFKSPSLSLLAKLGSIAVHAEEFLSPGGHEFDVAALNHLLRDAEVVQWMKAMGPLLPRKR